MIFNVNFSIFLLPLSSKNEERKKEYYFSSIIGKFIKIIFKFLNFFIFIIKQERENDFFLEIRQKFLKNIIYFFVL